MLHPRNPPSPESQIPCYKSKLKWGWVFLERTRILSGIQFTTHFIDLFVVETKRSSVVLYTWSWRGKPAASARAELRNMFPISKCRGDRDLGLCTTSLLAFGEPQRNGKIRFFLRQNTFSPRILPSRCGSPNASHVTEVKLCSSAGRRIAASRSFTKLPTRIVSFPQQKFRWNAL